MKDQLNGKVIWITGVLGLIGRSAAAAFLERGAWVIGTDLSEADGAHEVSRLRERYDNRFTTFVSDAADEAQTEEAVRRIREAYGRLDGLFHTAYTQIWKRTSDTSLAEWEAVVRGTLTSTFLVNRCACYLMMESGGGAIVNTSSILGQVVIPDAPVAYAAAKAGLNQLTRIVAAEYAVHGIRANAIVPGDIKAHDHPNQHAANLIGRSGTPEEVADLAAFLLSDHSAYMTGSLYPIDGGFGQ